MVKEQEENSFISFWGYSFYLLTFLPFYLLYVSHTHHRGECLEGATG